MSVKHFTLDEYAKQVGGLPLKLETAIIKGLRSAAMRGVGEVVHSINATSPHPPIDTGELARSVDHSLLPRGGRLAVDAPHAAVMENGARPFRPPFRPLYDWAKRKFGVDDKEAKQIARRVQRAIQQRGIAPRHYFRGAMRKVRQIIPIEVESELAKI